jgi:beta-N-acetylhexosaminidase
MDSPTRRPLATLAALLIAMTIAGCTGSTPPATSTPSSSATATPTPAPPPDPIAGLTLEQRVGQVFMVGTTASGAEDATLSAVRDRHVGNVFLSGRSRNGSAATAAVVAQFTALVTPESTAGLPLLVSTDQEGGQVQVLSGPGISQLPSGLQQGALAPEALEAGATQWGAELKASGVNMNLAPVVDLIPSAEAAASNPPIGRFDREYAFDVAGIVSHAGAFRRGMAANGVVTVDKHFPGLGDVTGNTDDTAGVTDSTTSAQSPSVEIYRQEIAAGAPAIMMSSANYALIDGTLPAAFSPAVTRGLLRDQLGFTGVIMTDDMSGATQVAAWSPADRAILSIQAGCDIVLVSRSPAVAAEMVDAAVAKAQADPAFAALIDAAARRVVALKATL